MKNKKLLIVAVIVLLLIVGGGFMVMNKKKEAAMPSSNNNILPVSTTTSSMFTSIKDALSKSLSLECTFSDDQNRQTKSYIKNGAVRVDYTTVKQEDSGSMIMKDKTIYFWNSKQGFMMNVPDEVAQQAMVTGTVKQGADAGLAQSQTWMAALEKYKDNCKPSVVNDNVFTPPSDVKFTDYSKLMQKGTSGDGKVVPTLDSAQIQKYMQEYGNKTSQ